MRNLIINILFLVLFFSGIICFADEEILVIYDTSLSMIDKLAGKPKYKIAAEEIINAMHELPDKKPIGLRIIGVLVDERITNYLFTPSLMCKATDLIVPIKSNNFDNVKNALNPLIPLGSSPIEYALQNAISYDFSHNATLKHIILVTDGIDSCNGNPCQYIKNLRRSRNDIKIDVLAVGANAADLAQLKCLSDSTFGEIINATTPLEIKTAYIKFLTSYKDWSYVTPDTNNEDIIYKNYLLEFSQ